jgi:predicted small metal-binding protein
MRVIECNLCGQVLQADDDDKLVETVAGHMSREHADAEAGEEQVRAMVDRDAYTATDA